MKATAVLNKKVQPNKLTVSGSIVTYNEKDTVHLDYATPQGINPTILLLDVKVTEIPGHKKGTEKPFIYVQIENAGKYRQVELHHGGDHLVVDVEIMG
jgi:hypothetical protein